MKKLFMYGLLLGCLATPITILGQEKITITGKLIDAVTGKKPVAVVTINEKGVGEYFVFDEITSNHHTIMDEKGNFSIEIEKGGSLVLNSTGYFKRVELKNLTKSQHVDVKMHYFQKPKTNLNFNPIVFNIGVKTYTVKGKVTNADTGKPLKMVSVTEPLLYNERGTTRHTVTDENGNYSITIHERNSVDFDGMGAEKQEFKNITSDRTINVALKLRTR